MERLFSCSAQCATLTNSLSGKLDHLFAGGVVDSHNGLQCVPALTQNHKTLLACKKHMTRKKGKSQIKYSSTHWPLSALTTQYSHIQHCCFTRVQEVLHTVCDECMHWQCCISSNTASYILRLTCTVRMA